MKEEKTTSPPSKLRQRRGKLAVALRENLKRRKAKSAGKPQTENQTPPENTSKP